MQPNEETEVLLMASCCPFGHRYTLVLISLTKRLLAEEMPAAYRMQFLKHLEKMGAQDMLITADVIAAVEPVCDEGYEMIREAQELSTNKALDAYAKFLPAFAALNPSLMAALKLSPVYQNTKRAEPLALCR
jgi:hypothetical protein